MFITKQNDKNREKYWGLLQAIGSLSQLASDSDSPYLYYRVAEKIFVMAFDASDLSRSDVSIDVERDNIGIGLKTFLYKNGHSFEKIAEFNKDRALLAAYDSKPENVIQKIAALRNKRLTSTGAIHDIDANDFIYHCVTRRPNEFIIHEAKMRQIDSHNITNIKSKNNVITFDDNHYEYSFNLAKSTLFQKFNIVPIAQIAIEILDNPFDLILKLLQENNVSVITEAPKQSILLPLYSPRINDVPKRSGLNQWNAAGRTRNEDEVYIPIPIWIHQKFPHFFPARDRDFNLHLPNKKILQAKICQDNDKALMSHPNKDLGKWLLRDILNLKPDILVTYDMLQQINIDSIEIIKHSHNDYYINFKQVGSYKNFATQHQS
ncbi:MAG: NgoFVII family restriction endonuclease [Alphaproteobacteria bacterium]|nr:NgoFVII family restriction endonuclease [Alphaproteobacteria bacterium]